MSKVAHEGRDRAGRFAQGNPGGPGRPVLAVERDYLKALSESVSLDDFKEIARRAVEDAKVGDKWAREWISRYVLTDGVKLSSLEADEFWDKLRLKI